MADITQIQVGSTTYNIKDANATSASILPNYVSNSEIKTKYRVAKKGYTGSEEQYWYYPIAEFPPTNNSNYASLIVSGRLGGWVADNMSYYQALIWNRGGTGIASIDISGTATTENGYFRMTDIVVYKDTETSKETVYLKCRSYFTFDLDLELFQSTANIVYDETYLTTEPSGTLMAQASTTTKRLALVNGKLLMNGVDIDTKYASLISPALTGTPTAPTAAAGTNTTQIATTAFVKNAVDSNQHTYYVKGTQTASTGSWTGNLPDVEALYEGLTIDYWLPYAGSGNATLNLTLKNGTTTGAINCYTGGTTRLTTHVGQYCILRLIYQTVTISGTSYTGWWLVRTQDNNDRASWLYPAAGSSFTAKSAVYRYQMLFQIDGVYMTPLNNADNTTATTKTMLTNEEFDPFGEIVFWDTTNIIAANGAINNTRKFTCAFDLRYTFNCGTSSLTGNRPLYLKVSLQSNGKVKLASASPLIQTLPSSDDGYLYIFLGRTYSQYQLVLYPWHPVYFHDGTKVVEYHNAPLASANYPGYMSAADKSKLDGLSGSYAPLASPALTGTPTAPTAADGTNTTQIATTAFVQSAFKANDAMIFKGTIGSSGATVTSLPATHYQGWTYKVATAGNYAGQNCEIGDTIMCITDGTSANNAHWTVIQSNIDGAVTGPASSTDAHVAAFNGTSGKIIKDSGYTISKSVPSDAKFTDTTYTNGNGISLSGTTFSAAFPTSGTPAALGTASNGSSDNVARADHVHAKPSYGNITTAGAITSDTAVANGDKIIVSDSSASGALIRTGITFDGSTTTKALTPKGTWENVSQPGHTHSASDITSGVLPSSRGGTGQASLPDAANALINSMSEASAASQRDDYIVSQYAGGGTTTTSYHRRKLSNIFKALNASDITTALGYTPPQQDTDTKVTNTLATTTKYYVTGTTSNSTNTGTQSFDTGIYATTTAGQLNAATYKVNEQVTLQWNSSDESLDFVFA